MATTEELLISLLSAVIGGSGVGGLLVIRARARIAREERLDIAALKSDDEFRTYLQKQIDAAEARHAEDIGQRKAQHALEIAQREQQHTELMSALDLTRSLLVSAEARAAASEERAANAEARTTAAETRVAELEAEVAELRAWRRSMDAKTPTDLRPIKDGGVSEWRSRAQRDEDD